MARIKIPGVYKITIIPTGKVYIGQTKDIEQRLKKHVWLATSNSAYTSRSQLISKEIRKYGVKNVMFEVLCSGAEYASLEARTEAEIKYIAEYKSWLPEFGYNEDKGGDPGAFVPREQSKKEKLMRAKSVFLYDMETEEVYLFFGGAKAVGKYLGFDADHQYGKDVVSHAVKRGLRFLRKYYVVYANEKLRHEQLEKIKERCEDVDPTIQRAVSRKKHTYEDYKRVVEYIDQAAHDAFGL